LAWALAVAWALLWAFTWAAVLPLGFHAFLLAVAVAFFFTAVVEAFRVTFATALLAAGADFFAAAACRLVVVVPQDTAHLR
jgi:hypothetical protein